jgi:hypothetical protein
LPTLGQPTITSDGSFVFMARRQYDYGNSAIAS